MAVPVGLMVARNLLRSGFLVGLRELPELPVPREPFEYVTCVVGSCCRRPGSVLVADRIEWYDNK